jgi:UDP-GlcNAc:undecaprenyl-phosphate GlcNAc-1-phosphate transferase
MPLLTIFLLALLLSWGLTWMAIRWSQRIAFIDRVGAEAHKQHARSVPYGGGPAFLLAMTIAAAVGLYGHLVGMPGLTHVLSSSPDHARLWPAAVGAGLLMALGLMDDKRPLPALPKLVFQTVVALLTVWACDLPIAFLNQFGVPGLGHLAGAFWLIVVCNAFNLIDHADGLSASSGIISAGVLLFGCMNGGDERLGLVFLALIGALFGYLWWNRPPARIYMGDAGSLPLGFIIGVGTLAVTFWPSTKTEGSWLAIFTPLIITAVPLWDNLMVVIKRLRRGQPIMKGDRNHVGHRLVRLGLSPNSTLAVVTLIQLALAASAIQLRHGDVTTSIIVLVQGVAIFLALILLETSRDHGPTPKP